MKSPEPFDLAAKREQLRLDVAATVSAHSGYSWTGVDGPCSGSKVTCNGPGCDWGLRLEGTSADQRRALHPAHVAHMLEPAALAYAESLRAEQVTA